MDLDAPKSWLGLAENNTEIKMEIHVDTDTYVYQPRQPGDRADTCKYGNASRQRQ
jgi:hypothetical protein